MPSTKYAASTVAAETASQEMITNGSYGKRWEATRLDVDKGTEIFVCMVTEAQNIACSQEFKGLIDRRFGQRISGKVGLA